MNKFGILLGHSYISKLKSKSFLITTAILLIGVLVMGNMNRIIDLFSGGSQKDKIVVIDQTHNLYQPFKQQLKMMNSDIRLYQAEGSEAEIKKSVMNEKYKGYLVISLDQAHMPQATYKATELTDTAITNQLKQALQAVKGNMAAAELKLSSEQLMLLNSPVSFKSVNLQRDVKSEEELAQARGLVYILLFAIYFAVIFYASAVGTEVATEKASRVMEILISSVSPVQQMFAKILGGALLGLTQMAVLLAAAYFSVKSNLKTLSGGFFDFFGFSDIEVSTIIYAVVFFLLGYLLYATLAALLGSLVSRIEDAQQMMMPMTFLVMIGFFLAMAGLGNPSATYVTVLSYVPFFTPMLMFLRVGMLDLPMWVGISGAAVLLVMIVLMAIIGARIYRGGVLLYGKSNSLRSIRKALQLSKGE
ncbi:ABC transporter permease [Heyndrickxia acidiproducens]|uniref:ABC transporter permease n=1 Tax=Heyndrickxia acidiproducens TaxID=1121084 RepID=UPI00037F754B|nr:ABC transporter permease [Heyndrickxia acidiproducens]